MQRQAQHLLNFLIDRAGKSVGIQTSIPWMDVVAASLPPRGGIRLRQATAGDVVYLRKAGFIKMPEPQWEGEPPKEDGQVMTYELTARGLISYSTADLDPQPITWRDLTPEERARR